jgi:hypothetical protein
VLLASTLTTYIFVGSCLKDRRLEFFLGDAYRTYAAQVPGYPLMLIGPLARWSTDRMGSQKTATLPAVNQTPHDAAA